LGLTRKSKRDNHDDDKLAYPRVCVVDDQQWDHLVSRQERPSGGEVPGVHRELRYQVCWQGSQTHGDRCVFRKSCSKARAFS
jgi:hypothetical protein